MVTALAPSTAASPATVPATGPAWRLVGPWYRWPRPALPDADARATRPAIQKFAGDDFIAAFMERPQHSLKYDEVVDVVNNYDLISADSKLIGKIGTLLKLNDKGHPTATGPFFRARLAPSNLRKLYQPTHDRHYLVTCQLHCEQPGFPRVGRQQVCQAGFVLRRRRSLLPEGMDPSTVTEQAKAAQALEADLLEFLALDAAAADPKAGAEFRTNALAQQQKLAEKKGQPDWATLLAVHRTALEAERRRLQQWYDANGVGVEVQGWFPTLLDGRPSKIYGEWRALTQGEQLADITSGEQHYPMFALVPDPRLPDHDAAGRTLYYGTVPTAGLEHDANGLARFDDQATYEVRCFVRRHHACPGRTGKSPDCHGGLTWSLPTEPFRVAAAFDVLGAANRPITIKMPDLRELAAQAALRPRGKLSPVRFVQPQHLSPKVVDNVPQENDVGGEAICSFSIPLITIIALFLLNLFLPIVVFIFGLWFLLVFRFCIPPKVELAAGVDAALALSVTPPSVELDGEFTVHLNGLDKLVTPDQLHAALTANPDPTTSDPQLMSMAERIRYDNNLDKTPDLQDRSNNALGPISQSLDDHAALKADSQGVLPPPPPVGTPLVYEDPVTPLWPPARAGT